MDTTGRDWQKQSFAKGGSKEAAPSQMNPKLHSVPGTSMNSKIAKPTYPGGMVHGGSMKKAPLHMADGGSVDDETYNSKQYQDDKAAGLEASKNESVGLFERFKMGNIDDPSSEAYRRFGAGRGMAERMKSMPDESEAETKRLAATAPAAPAPSGAAQTDDNQSAAETARLQRQNDSGMSTPSGGSTGRVSKPAAVAKPAPVKVSAPKVSDDDTYNPSVKQRSVVVKPKATVRGADFDPDAIDNFSGSKPAQPAQPAVRRHPRTGRPY